MSSEAICIVDGKTEFAKLLVSVVIPVRIASRAFSGRALPKIPVSIQYNSSEADDMSGVEIEVTDDKVTVTLPEVQVDDPQVDLDSIDFYDESFAIFNWDDKVDGIDAVKVARDDCREKADIDGLKGKAYENAKKIVTELLEDLIGDRELEVK